MSSLAAVQADGFYHPPEYDPTKHGSVSKFHGSKGNNQWLKQGVIRLELPFKSWCLHPSCGRVIDQGTRFNAKKAHVDDYFSTRIYEFRMRCPSCESELVMRTDPKNRTYEYVSGIRKFSAVENSKRGEEVAEEGETSSFIVSYLDKETKERIENDPLFALEHCENDKKRASKRVEELIELHERKEVTCRDDVALNRALRKRNRTLRNKENKLLAEGKQIGLGIALIEETEEDSKQDKELFRILKAEKHQWDQKSSHSTQNRKAKRHLLRKLVYKNKINAARSIEATVAQPSTVCLRKRKKAKHKKTRKTTRSKPTTSYLSSSTEKDRARGSATGNALSLVSASYSSD